MCDCAARSKVLRDLSAGLWAGVASCGEASRRQAGGNEASVGAHHLVAETNVVVERFHHSLKHEHLYQREIDNTAELAEEVRSFLVSFNEIRPHEALGQRPPRAVHLTEPHLFQG